MAETRKLAAILAADIAGYSTLAGADEERTLARLRAFRSDLIDPTIALHHGRVVKSTGDGCVPSSTALLSRLGLQRAISVSPCLSRDGSSTILRPSVRTQAISGLLVAHPV